MPTDIGWKQSIKSRTNFMTLLNETIDEVKTIITLQNELLQKQLVESGAIKPSDIAVDVNSFSTYEKQEEIRECELNMHDNLYLMRIAMLDDSDLIFMNFNELERKIKPYPSDIEDYVDEVNEIKGEMEEY